MRVQDSDDDHEADMQADGDGEKPVTRTSGTYISTAAEDELNIEVKPPERRHGRNKPTPRVNILGDRVFESSKLETLQRATVFRLSHVTKSKRNASKKTICRRKKLQEDSSGSESDVRASNVSLNTDKDDGFDFDEDYDFDADHDHGFAHSFHDNQEDYCQSVYKKMCGTMDIMMSNYFLRHLLTTEIIMKHSYLGVRGAKACCAALLENCKVKTLHLEGNDIGPEGTRYVAELLTENNIITSLAIAENDIRTEGLIALKEVIHNNEFITSLDLSGNNLDESDATHIAEILEENTILKVLLLHHNAFRELGGVTIAKGLSSNDSLEVLDLGWNHLRRNGVKALAEALAENLGVTHLNVAWNGFYLDGCRAMAKALKTNKTLEILDLTCNRIDYECLQELMKGLVHTRTITTLKLSNNPLSTQGASELLQMIENNVEIPIRDIDIKTQCIDVPFLRVLDRIRDSDRQIRVKHGIILDQTSASSGGDEEFLHEDPMMVLMECMRMMNLRLVDLFSSLDKDGSKSLTYDEFKNGLLNVHVPMSVKAIERLIKKLDTDGDREVDYAELLEGQKLHQKKLRRLRTVESDLPYEETELGRISMKLKSLMSKRQAIARAKLEEEREQRARDRMVAIGNAGAFVAKTSEAASSKRTKKT